MQPTTTDCDDCVPAYLRPTFDVKAAFSTLPFAATFVILTLLAYRRVYPVLSSATGKPLPKHPARAGGSQNVAAFAEPASQTLARRIAAITFSSTIALSVVLTELLLCEISNSLNPSARSLALQITIASLLGLLVVAIPLLGIYSVVSKSGYSFVDGSRGGRLRLAWILEFTGYAIFLFGFWAIGNLLPQRRGIRETLQGHQSLFQACLDRLGITGVTLMALLSGFASVSAIWQSFGPKAKAVNETDITRKQAGLDATNDMIFEKKERLQHLERKLAHAPSQGFWSRTVGSIRGNPETQERQTLEIEISGLETMSSSLESSLSILRARRANQLQATTSLGRVSMAFSYIFSLYCIYRIFTTALSMLRRALSSTTPSEPGTSDSTGEIDPVTYFIALFARHVYPSLDRASWAQQISFLLSGIMLLASFSAVTQTFHLFTRFLPSLLHATRTNFALLISQISGMYVISSALMLRGMMPQEVGGVITSALGAGLLEPRWVQKWFDGFFMTAVSLTVFGIFLGRQLGGTNVFDDDVAWDNDVEMGKRTK